MAQPPLLKNGGEKILGRKLLSEIATIVTPENLLIASLKFT